MTTDDQNPATALGDRPTARTVFVSGNFNIVHPGHVRLLRFAADCGNSLTVGVLPDGEQGVTIRADDRLEGVSAISVVDDAFILTESVAEYIARAQPAIVVKGKEHERVENVEQAAVEAYGGKLIFSSGEVQFSSLDLLRREFLESDFASITHQYEYRHRHAISEPDLHQRLEAFSSLRVGVVGDLILDEYITCEPIGLSQEDPTIVVTPIDTQRFVGGAGIVAAHASGLGAEVQYFGLVGDDEGAVYAASTLGDYGVASQLVADTSRPTILKQRYRASGTTLLRVSHLKQHEPERRIAGELVERVVAALPNLDLLVLSDFSYGCLPPAVLEPILQAARQHDVMIAADSQSSSQIGDIARFQGATLITPTEREARIALRDFTSGLVIIADQLAKAATAKHVIITLGSEGALLHINEDGIYHTDRLASMNSSPKDTAGAGDSMLATTAMALCSGATPWESAYLGGMAAACQVSRVGNTPITAAELATEISLGNPQGS